MGCSDSPGDHSMKVISGGRLIPSTITSRRVRRREKDETRGESLAIERFSSWLNRGDSNESFDC